MPAGLYIMAVACQRLLYSWSRRSHSSRGKYLQQQQQGFESQICIAQGVNLCLAMTLWLSAKKLPVPLPGTPALEPYQARFYCDQPHCWLSLHQKLLLQQSNAKSVHQSAEPAGV